MTRLLNWSAITILPRSLNSDPFRRFSVTGTFGAETATLDGALSDGALSADTGPFEGAFAPELPHPLKALAMTKQQQQTMMTRTRDMQMSSQGQSVDGAYMNNVRKEILPSMRFGQGGS
jgi:hypothetical protein